MSYCAPVQNISSPLTAQRERFPIHVLVTAGGHGQGQRGTAGGRGALRSQWEGRCSSIIPLPSGHLGVMQLWKYRHPWKSSTYKYSRALKINVNTSTDATHIHTLESSVSACGLYVHTVSPFIPPSDPSPAAGPGCSWPVPSIIPRKECIKDSSLQLNLKGKTITPGIGAELWRPPIKLFAFDLVLSVLPRKWMWTGEYMDRLKGSNEELSYTLYSCFSAVCPVRFVSLSNTNCTCVFHIPSSFVYPPPNPPPPSKSFHP